MKLGRTLVTGASGFIGGHLVEALRARGVDVRVLVRTSSLADRAAIRPAFEGVENVLHLAARVHVMRETERDAPTAFREANVLGTQAVLEEAAAAGARRFVFFSSVKALGESSKTPFDEDTTPAPLDPYGASKLEAESLLRASAERLPIGHVILRLPLVYGPRMKGNMLRLFGLVDRGRPIPLATGVNARSMVYVGNLVAATCAVLENEVARNQTFMVSDGVDLSTRELVTRVGRALGRSPHVLPVPTSLYRVLGLAGDALSYLVRVPFTSDVVERLTGSLVVDSTKLRRVVGFAPPYDLDRAFAETASWYRSRPAP